MQTLLFICQTISNELEIFIVFMYFHNKSSIRKLPCESKFLTKANSTFDL